jgi:hypothetical protein
VLDTHLEQALFARGAGEAALAEPGASDAVADFVPVGRAVADGDNAPDVLVARDVGERAHHFMLDEGVGVAAAAGLDFDEEFSRLGQFEGPVFDDERLAFALEDGASEGLGEGGGGRHGGCGQEGDLVEGRVDW